MNEKRPTGTVTFLFTDIEGSTKLAQEYPETWETLRERHDTILRSAIEGQNGYVFRIIGDAFCAAFHTAADALRAALRAQLDLHVQSREGPTIKARMGIHTGHAEIREDGEYRGYLTLTRVQRVMSVGHGGQTLLSNATAELIRSDLPEDVTLLDLSEHRLKGLQGSEHLWQVVTPSLPRDFPPLQSLRDVPTNLPMQLTSFVGREKELALLREQLGNHRLITLTGPGGVGKTRLSIETAASLVNDFQHGVWFVELANVTDPALVPVTIAHVFNVPEVPGRNTSETLKDYLRDKELLLILDNFEQVIEAATLVKEFLLAAPGLKVLISSRTPLRIGGEYEYRVPLLPLPSQEDPFTLERLAPLGSVQLFVERAQSAKADFALTRDNAAAVAETCLRLDGLPLAIELAAARVRVLPPQKMLSQLDNRLKFLTSSARDLPSRQQTLRGAISWSYDLLTESERSFFRQLAVFMGGATLEAIDFVVSLDRLDVLTYLESLLDKSLLRQSEQEGEARFEMLETIRDFADEMLVASGEDSEVQARHLMYFHGLAHEAEPFIVSSQELEWIMRLTREHENLRAAILWGLKHDIEKAVEILCDLTLFWSRGGHNEEVIGWLRLALSSPILTEAPDAPSQYLNLKARSLLSLGILSLQQEYPQALSTLHEAVAALRRTERKSDLALGLAFIGFLGDLNAAQESVDIARSTHDAGILASCLIWQSQALRLAGGDLQLAREAAAEGARLSRAIGSTWAVARSVFSQGQLAAALAEWGEARAHFRESMESFLESQDRYHSNMARTELAHVERRQGNYAEALELSGQALLIWQDLGLPAAIAHQLEDLVMIAAGQGHIHDGVRLAGAASKLREKTGSQLKAEQQIEYDHVLNEVRGQMEMHIFQGLLREGEGMSISEAIRTALSLSGRPSSSRSAGR